MQKNPQKLTKFFYTNNEISQRQTKNKITFTIATMTTKNNIPMNKLKQRRKRPVLRKLQNTEERN